MISPSTASFLLRSPGMVNASRGATCPDMDSEVKLQVGFKLILGVRLRFASDEQRLHSLRPIGIFARQPCILLLLYLIRFDQ